MERPAPKLITEIVIVDANVHNRSSPDESDENNALCSECSLLCLEDQVPSWVEGQKNPDVVLMRRQDERGPDPILLRTSTFPLRDKCSFCRLFYDTGMVNEGSLPREGFEVWLQADSFDFTGSDKALVHVQRQGAVHKSTRWWFDPDIRSAIHVEIPYSSRILHREWTKKAEIAKMERSTYGNYAGYPGRDHEYHYRFCIPGCTFAPRMEVTAYLTSSSWSCIKNSLDACRQRHESCIIDFLKNSISSRSRLHIRLIDCKRREILTLEENCPPYIALSYVWGQSSMNNSAGFKHVRPGVPSLTRLPKTVEDAVQATLNLGFDFLWVDQYCIDQNDHRVKSAQIQLMDQIYSSAAVVLIIASGTDANSGIPGISHPRQLSRARATNGRVFTSSLFRPEDAIVDSVWATRGWTFQEGLLACHRLIFTDREWLMECRSQLVCESAMLPAPRSNTELHRRGYFFANGLEPPLHSGMGQGTIMWTDNLNQTSITLGIINRFAKRKFTFYSDRLDAICGILKLYCEHWAGVPYRMTDTSKDLMQRGASMTEEQLLAFFLSWVHEMPLCGDAANSTKHVDLEIKRLETFPSVSWAGWTGPIIFLQPTNAFEETRPQFDLVTIRHADPRMGEDTTELTPLTPAFLEIKVRVFGASADYETAASQACILRLKLSDRVVLEVRIKLPEASDVVWKEDNVLQVPITRRPWIFGFDDARESTSAKKKTSPPILSKILGSRDASETIRTKKEIYALLLSKISGHQDKTRHVLLLVTPAATGRRKMERLGLVVLKATDRNEAEHNHDSQSVASAADRTNPKVPGSELDALSNAPLRRIRLV